MGNLEQQEEFVYFFQITAFVREALKLGFANDEIGVITPYCLQVNKLREQLSNEQLSIFIGSIDESEGLERKIILISTFGSEKSKLDMDVQRKLGFIKRPKRINVTNSRARYFIP